MSQSNYLRPNSLTNDKCNHEENRIKVCAPCGRKIIFGKKKISAFSISENINYLLKKYVNDQFDISNSRFPTSICSTCRNVMIEHGKSIMKRPLPIMPNYQDINLAKETRNMSCNCYICLTAQFKGHVQVNKGRGHERTFISPKITKDNGLDGTMTDLQLPTSRLLVPKTSMNICKNCFQQLGKGVPHNCNGVSSTSARHNVLNLVEKLPEKRQSQLLSSLLKRHSGGSKDDILLNTAGTKIRVTLNKKKEKNVFFSPESLDNFQSITAVSRNHMNKMTNFIRSVAGRDCVPANYKEHMHQKSTSLDHMYEEGIHKFETDKGKVESRPVVYANAPKLLELIFEKRGISTIENCRIKLMADGGQGFFKISITVLTEEESYQSDELENRRALYSAGGSVTKKRNLNSVYRLLLLGIVPRIKESHGNMKTLFELSKINEIPFKFASDFKLILIVNGQQTASSNYPCPYCFITLNELHSFNASADDENIILKTYKDLKNDYNKYQSMGNNKKLAKDCRSTVNHPLFVKEEDDEDDEMYVIEKCILPELHLLQGFVNHLFWNGIVPLIGREKALLWPQKLSLVPKTYQGEIFEGNHCRQLLKEADKLDDPEIYEKVGPFPLQSFIVSFKIMNKIVDSCFSIKRADISNLDANLSDLRKAIVSTGVSQTLKIHVLLDHLKGGIAYLNNDGLGLWSEQAGESVHREFLKYWERFKINSIEDKSFLRRLKKAVVTFSSQHM